MIEFYASRKQQVRGRIVKQGGGCILMNRSGKTIAVDTVMNFYSGFYINSFETRVDEGVKSNRKLDSILTINGENLQIILNGWTADDVSHIVKDLPFGAEFCSHSCRPNSKFIIDEDFVISGSLQAGGKTHTISFSPTFLIAVDAIKDGEEITVDYGDLVCVKTGFYDERVQRHLASNPNILGPGMKSFMQAHNLNPQLTPEQKKSKGHNSETFPGMDCMCTLCNKASSFGIGRTLLLMCDSYAIDYAKMRRVFFGEKRSAEVMPNTFRPRDQPMTYANAMILGANSEFIRRQTDIQGKRRKRLAIKMHALQNSNTAGSASGHSGFSGSSSLSGSGSASGSGSGPA
jgi:hypothetical protein